MKKQTKREREIFRKCKYFMGRTKWDKNLAHQLSPNAKYYHCDEILRDKFYLAEWVIHDNPKKIFYSTIGNNNYKGIETLVESGLILKNKNHFDFEFRVGGISENDELYRIVKNKYGVAIDNFLKPMGNMSADNVVEAMLSADLFVHPSHIDNSPNSVCEAMLVGTPVVSTDVGGIPSLIENEIDGLLVPSGNANLMTEAILRILKDKVLSVKLSKNARKRAIERHNKEKIVTQLMSIYQEIITANL
jgi:glycosyltransferase involved in cell wall biosynthesis